MKLLETLSDFEKAALVNYAKTIMNVEPSLLLAVILTECSGVPFDSKGRITIQYEPHVFYARLFKHGIDAEIIADSFYRKHRADICRPTWTREYYLAGTDDDYERLNIAKSVHVEAALESCSYGIGQIMGSYWKRLGFNTVFEFVEANHSPLGQLQAFAKFLLTGKEILHLRSGDMPGFFRLYNGSGYKEHKYDERFEENLKVASELGY